ncbi:MAG: restriction endonuclease, partial [Myxococcota bacterium]
WVMATVIAVTVVILLAYTVAPQLIGVPSLVLMVVLAVVFNGLIRRFACSGPAASAEPYTLDELDQLTGHEFEAWVADTLEDFGLKISMTPASGDFGVDVIAEYEGRRIGIQAKKRVGKNIGNAAVQQVNAGADYYRCRYAAVVTQSYFTKAARAQANGLTRPCVLIGRAELDRMGAVMIAAIAAAEAANAESADVWGPPIQPPPLE